MIFILVQTVLVVEVDGGITIVHLYTLTVSTIPNMEYISIISGIHYHLLN